MKILGVMMRHGVWAIVIFASYCFAPMVYGAEAAGNTFIFYWENDAMAETDRYYTNGMKLIWVSGPLAAFSEDQRIPTRSGNALESLPVINTPETTKHVALSLGQKIFTPRDIDNPNLIVDDRPYAGWTFAGITLHSKGTSTLDTLEFDVGLIGPQSYARDVQVEMHKLLKSREPRGWEHQLKNEVGLALVYERKWRFWQIDIGGSNLFDFIPHLGAAVGNVYTYANAGGEIRLGFNLPDDFGTALIRPAGDASIPAAGSNGGNVGMHLFAGVDGRAVLRNIFLDGNTFTDSHSVDKKNFVADIMVGASLTFERIKITYSHVYKTKEFDTQADEQIFGSISVAFSF